MAVVPFHTHEFEIPTASSAEVIAGTEAGKVVTPAALGPLATLAGITPGTVGLEVIEDETASDVRTTIGVVIGTDVQAYDADLAAIAALTSAADKGIQFTGSGTAATYDLTAAGKALLDDANASAQRTTLGLAIGTDVQAYDAGLQSISGLTVVANRLLYTTATDTYAAAPLSALARDLLADATSSEMRNTLELGTAATSNVGDFATGAEGDLAVTAVQPVATITALKALTPVAGKLVDLLQGAPSASGRFGSFICVAGSPPHADTAEGVYIVSDTASFYWKRVFTGPYNACWFGAVGDNSTDNATAHAAVIAFAIAAGEDAVIYYPAGEYRFNSSVNGYRASTGIALTFIGDGFDATFILSNYYDAGSVMWDFIDPALTSRVAPTNFVGLNFGSVSRAGGVNPRYLRIHGWGNSEMREVKFNPSNNTQFSAGGMQNIKMNRVEGWFGGKMWLWKATAGITFDITAGGVLTSSAAIFSTDDDDSGGRYITLNHASGRRRYRITGFTSTTEVQVETVGYRILAATGLSGWFGNGHVNGTITSNQYAFPVGMTGPFVAADIGRVVLIKRSKAGTYDAADFSITRGIISSVTSDRVFRIKDEAGNDILADRSVTLASIATPCFDFYQPLTGGATLTAGSSHVEITKLHMEHYTGVALYAANTDAWLIQGKIHGETSPSDTIGSFGALWLDDIGCKLDVILDSSCSLGGERIYRCNNNKTTTIEAFSRNTINEIQIRSESSTPASDYLNVVRFEMANYYDGDNTWIVDESATYKYALGYIGFGESGGVPIRRAVTSNRTDQNNEATLTSTITWDGTAPSGTGSKRYRWRQVGDRVDFVMRGEYSTPGVTNTNVTIAMPSDMPTPSAIAGTSANGMVIPLTGFFGAGETTVNPAGITKAYIYDDGAGGYGIRLIYNSGSSAADFFCVSGFYWTNDI